MAKSTFLVICALGAVALGAGRVLYASEGSDTPRELGDVRWSRDFDASQQRAAAVDKPLFLLFQEVPGCQTCVSFGDEVLSHPLLIEAIEDAFVPVAIFNNHGGADRRVLDRFGEPSWNNPVVRLLSPDGRDLVPRAANVWSPHGIAERMTDALAAAQRPVPGYLRETVDELAPRPFARATFSMDCYWSGEACLGGIDGVLSSRTGYLGRREVVEVRYDPRRVRYATLLEEARRRGCADRVFTHDAAQGEAAQAIFRGRAQPAEGALREARARDQKYYLRRSELSKLTLTPRQALRVNHALWDGRDPSVWLSPRQRQEGTRG